jgi:hypothetical protein
MPGNPYLLVLLLLLAGALVAAILLIAGALRWRTRTNWLLANLEAARTPFARATFDPHELDDQPGPVRHYFRAVLQPGQPVIAAVRVTHSGTFNMSDSGEQSKPFHSTQRVVTRRPGFVWDARIAMMPGIAAHVHDAYVGGEGILHASALGLVTVMNLRGTPDVAEGELFRYFAEAAWYPTALLPSQGIRWSAVDERSARATLQDGKVSIAMLFRFSEQGLITSVRAEARGRTVGTAVVPTPWEGTFGNYQMRDGMRVPLEAEVAWLTPEGPKPYWRGHITSLRYEFAG